MPTDKGAYKKWVNRCWHRVSKKPWAECVYLAFLAGYRAAMKAERTRKKEEGR